MSQTLHSAAEILPQLLKDEGVLNGEGSIAFTKPDKTTARIFLRQGNIYAVDNLEYEVSLWTELKFEDRISHGNLRALIRAHKSQRDSLYKLLKRTRSRTKNEEGIAVVLQEYVLGAIDNIYSWESVKVEWRMGDSFQYDAANVPPFSLSHLTTLCANRSLYKFNKYSDWGFKDDYQFNYGEVQLEGDLSELKPSSKLEEAMIQSAKFTIKALTDSTGYSLYSISSTLDDLNKRIKVTIENPSGRQLPKQSPVIPQSVPVIRDKVHFSATDEDPNMLKAFNTEYHVPEPALLEYKQSEAGDGKTEDTADETFKTFDEVINDTSSMEVINMDLPPLPQAKKSPPANGRAKIPEDELRKELEANTDLADLYKIEVPKSRGVVKKPVASMKRKEKEEEVSVTEPETETLPPITIAPETETRKARRASEASTNEDETIIPKTPEAVTPEQTTEQLIETLTHTLEGKEMSDMSLFELLGQVESQLVNQKSQIETRKRTITEKEVQLNAAKQEVSRITLELANEIGAKESAIADHEKALKIIEALKN